MESFHLSWLVHFSMFLRFGFLSSCVMFFFSKDGSMKHLSFLGDKGGFWEENLVVSMSRTLVPHFFKLHQNGLFFGSILDH
jgi:hypothetical protein